MNILLIILSLSFVVPVLGAECFVVSGIEKDHSNSLKNKNFFKNGLSKVAGKDCTVVRSWKELNQAIASKKIPKGGDVLVVQGAHGADDYDNLGNKNPRFLCDADEPTASEVLGHLNKLSEQYRVGATIHSCFSGEIMKQKLLQDEIDGKNLDKLCLYTSSSTGRIAYGRDGDIIGQLEKSKPGQTLENLFLKVKAGMISSAAWSEIGLPEYFSKKTVEEGYKTLQALDKITRGQFTCESDLGAANAALCAAPGVTDAVFEDLMTFQDPIIPDSVKGEVVANFKNYISMAQAGLKKKPGDKLLSAQQSCFKFVLTTYQENYGNELENLESWDYIESNIPIFKKLPGFASCMTYSKLLPADNPKTPEQIIQNNFENGTRYYRESVDKLQRRYSKRNIDDTFDIKDFAKAASGEKSVCNPNDKQQIIQSMFGESFFFDEMASDNQPDEMIMGRKVSTQLALKSFQNASLGRKSLELKDEKRAKACKDFKL